MARWSATSAVGACRRSARVKQRLGCSVVAGFRGGCVQNDSNYRRESGFFAIAIERFFSFCADWHQDDRARPLVRQYQTTLDSVLQSHPELRGCIAYCTDCGIRFLTHPRNASRRNLRCPFGCRQHHRRQCSCRRSTAYYRTTAGKSEEEAAQWPSPRRPGFAAAPTRSAGNVARPASRPCRSYARPRRQRAIARDDRGAPGRGGAGRIESGQFADAALRADGREPDRGRRTQLP